MSNTILSSPFLNLTIIDLLLAQPQPAIERVKLLSTRLSLLINSSPPPAGPSTGGASSTTSHRPRSEEIVEELETRLKLGIAYLELVPPGLLEAEGELGIVERRCKGLLRPEKPKSQRATVDVEDEEQAVEGNAVEGALDEEKEGRGSAIGDEWRARIHIFRVRAIEGLIHVEEARGHGGRAERWKEVLKTISSDAPGS